MLVWEGGGEGRQNQGREQKVEDERMREWGRKRGPEREEEKEAPRKVLVLAQRTGKTNRAALWSLSLDVHG